MEGATANESTRPRIRDNEVLHELFHLLGLGMGKLPELHSASSPQQAVMLRSCDQLAIRNDAKGNSLYQNTMTDQEDI